MRNLAWRVYIGELLHVKEGPMGQRECVPIRNANQ